MRISYSVAHCSKGSVIVFAFLLVFPCLIGIADIPVGPAMSFDQWKSHQTLSMLSCFSIYEFTIIAISSIAILILFFRDHLQIKNDFVELISKVGVAMNCCWSIGNVGAESFGLLYMMPGWCLTFDVVAFLLLLGLFSVLLTWMLIKRQWQDTRRCLLAILILLLPVVDLWVKSAFELIDAKIHSTERARAAEQKEISDHEAYRKYLEDHERAARHECGRCGGPMKYNCGWHCPRCNPRNRDSAFQTVHGN